MMSKATTAQTPSIAAKSTHESIWERFELKDSPKKKPPKRRFRWVVGAVLPLSLTFVAGIAVLLPNSLPSEARLSLFAFALAVILWSTTSLNAAYVALAAVVLLVLTGGASQEQLFDALASDVVWLMIGAFVLGGAVQQTGLAARLTQLVVARARTVGSVFWLLTTMLIPLSFFIPSTSGRAAVVIPVFRSIANAAGDRRITRALALLMPTIILVATITTLIGAGSHLVANDLLQQIAGKQISFAQWALYGLPFGVVASYRSPEAGITGTSTKKQTPVAGRMEHANRRGADGGFVADRKLAWVRDCNCHCSGCPIADLSRYRGLTLERRTQGSVLESDYFCRSGVSLGASADRIWCS
jgi:di/tricarboxylate transporter